MQESVQTYLIKSYLLLFVYLQSKCYRRPIFFSFHLSYWIVELKGEIKTIFYFCLFYANYDRLSKIFKFITTPSTPPIMYILNLAITLFLLEASWHLSPILRKKENLQFNVCESFAQLQNITYLPTWITLFYSSIKIHQNIVTI